MKLGKRSVILVSVSPISNLISLCKCILVKGWKSSSGWGFPKGKINEHEPPHECAIREVGPILLRLTHYPNYLQQVLEETGYNLAGQINAADVIEMSIKEQLISLFIVPGVPEDFPFKTRTRKEISVRAESFSVISTSDTFPSALSGLN
jgi:hypothetical protein